jgi:hypothetical protein
MNLILSLLRLSLTNPTDAGRVLVGLRLTPGTAFSAFALVIIAAVLLMFSLSGFQGVMLLPGFAPLSPWFLTAIMGGGTLGLCVCIWLISRAFSQSGRFADGLLVFAWIQLLQTLLLIVQTGLMVISVNIAGLVGLFATVLIFWILFGLMNAWLELESMLKAALCFVLGLVALSLGGAFLLVFFGFAPGQVTL